MVSAGPPLRQPHPQGRDVKLIFDTDIGDAYDDTVALALALASPEVELLGVTTVGGDVDLRARFARRFLDLAGRADVPVAIGAATPVSARFTQRRWAEAGPSLSGAEPRACDFMLEAVRRHPGEVTVLALGPLSNLAAALAAEPAAFAGIGRIVIMGGSIRRGYGDMPPLPPRGPSAEYNIVCDIGAARAVLGSGAPITLAPLDATMAAFDEMKRELVFTRSRPVTDALALTYLQWAQAWGRPTPHLFDAATLAIAIDPSLASAEPMRIEIDDAGFTRPAAGSANAAVCLDLDEARFFRFALPRLMGRGAP
jgi:purine nucleosidase